MTVEITLGLIGAVCAVFAAYLGWRKLRREQKDARVSVLVETNRIITENRDELREQNRRQQGEIDSLRGEVQSLKGALAAVNKLVTAEAAVAELRGLVVQRFDQLEEKLEAVS